jgi:hypothetical protein
VPEHDAIKFLRRLYKIRFPIVVVAFAGFLVWSIWGPTISNVGRHVVAPVSTQVGMGGACAGRPQPREGIYKWYGPAWGDDVADFTIRTAAGSNYFVKLEDLSGRPARAYFVHGGSTISYKVPLGTFVLKYASGKSWCSETELFGSDTATNQADRFFDFDRQVTEDATGITTSTSDITVELILRPGGNLRTHAIPRSQF